MSENKRDYVKECVATNTTGKHEYVTETLGELCKHCGLLRTTIENVEVPKDWQKDEQGNILSPFSADFRGTQIDKTAEEVASRIGVGGVKKKEISDDVYQQILKQTNSKAAIVLTFPEVIKHPQFLLRDFHISAVNVDYQTFPAVLAVIIDALLGRLGGIMNFRRDNKGGDEPPAPTAV